ncbi:hypothetical protein N5C16_00485 [Stenotrophomonas sp. GD03908]|uniref:hypothetical protein n=1 Tax=Stenotrophomonas sp. GD03908 TaxID=2975403 RepID=UPI0024495BAB|nr:hypothetical protein [Stenotrophomonas sp. GD03908]MDH0977742.1 hypothetical protein [Stenotrophomonas sp. GD03908]
MATPPLPPGFELVQEAQPQAQVMGNTPPLPEGFVLDDGQSQPQAQGAYANPVRSPDASSLFGRLLGLAAGPAPLQGNTPDERRADYESRPAAVRAATGVGQFIDSNIQGISQLAGTQTPAMADKGAFAGGVADNDLLTRGARTAAEIGSFAIPFSKVAKIPSIAGRIAASTGLGAGIGAIQEADSPDSRLANTVVSGIGGGLGELGGSALRVLGNKVTPEITALYNQAKRFGVELTPAQLSNSPFVQRATNLLRSMPLSGANQAWERQVGQFNQAVSREFGENAPKITPDVFASAKSRIGQEFEQLSARSKLNITDGLMERLGGLQQEAAAFADEGTVRAVGSAIDRMFRQSKDGVLPGQAYKSLDSTLGKIMASGGEKSFYIGQVRDAIREAMDESIEPAMRQAWQQARGQYKALKTVEPLVAKSADGSISPAQLMGRVTANNAGKSAMASGRGGNLGDLARVGQAMKSPSSSGTTENALVAQLGNPLLWPLVAARTAVGATAGRAANSNMLARLMADPQARGAVVNSLARLGGPLGILAAPAASAAVMPEPRRRVDED